MVRSRRSFAWSLVLALLCASFVAAQAPPLARAAGLTCPSGESCIVVTSAADPFNDVYPPAPNPQPDYKCVAPTADGCTLREAITLADAASAGVKTRIQFSVPRNTTGYATRIYLGQTVETWTIQLTAPLPAIDHDATVIDGFSQEQFTVGSSNNFGPTIVIDGGPLTNGTTAFPPQGTGGLLVQSSNNTIQGLGIINFKTSGTSGSTLLGIGIEVAANTSPVNSATGNVIRGCYLGVNEIGQNAAPNSYGLWVQTNNNTIGGSNALSSQDPNIISGNFNDGILLTGGNNLVRGNYIGLNRDGNVDIGNHESGVNMRTSGGNIIGTPSNPLDSTFGNIISGNDQNGVFLTNGSNNIINGNLIGTDATGGFAIGNGVDGIRVESSTAFTQNNKIGEKDFFNRNIISGNGGAGIHLAGFKTRNNVVLNNFIGPSAGGVGLSSGLSNRNGIIIDNGADSTTVGGALLGDFLSLAADNEANLISGNISDGVVISGTVSQDNKIFGNTIGLDESRGSLFGNGGRGIVVMNGPQMVTIGGAGSLGNVISANGKGGIYVIGKLTPPTAPITDVLILGNIIGLRRNPTANPYNASVPLNFPAGNNGDGVSVTNADKVRVGGSVAEANTIAKNNGNGIFSTGTNFTIVQNNSIGGLKSGITYTNLGNTGNGIRATGTVTAATNLVIYNGQNGFWVTGGTKSPLTANTVNFNSGHGFLVDGGAADIQITGSTIYSNTLNGVFVQGGGVNPQKVKIFDNSMTGNASAGNKKGIVLTPHTGVVTNPNHSIDPPYLLHIDQTGKLSGKIRLLPNSPAISACAQPCAIQVFTTNPQTLDTQGRDKVNTSVSIVPDSIDPNVGNFSAAVGKVPAQLALTATDKDGNTSEFSVLTRQFGLDIQPPRSGFAYPGQVITYTHRISNTGTVDFTNIQFTAFSSLGWPYVLAPIGDIALAAGESKPVTLTLTLPTGADPRVKFPSTDLTRLTISATTTDPAVVTTASITDTTNVLGKFILDASFKQGRTGSGVAGTVIDYPRTITNIGNITGTVTLTASTDLGWTTLITPTSVQLPPGKSIGVVSSITIPQGAIAGTVGKTTLTFDGTPDAQHMVITDTTTVLLTPKATMVFAQEADAGAGEPVQFCHTVTNLSNGPATFTLTGVSSLGSKVTFVSDTPGRTLVNGTTFTVGISDADKSFNFCANVIVDIRAQKGQDDQISIGLIDNQGGVVGGASVRDIIHVVRNFTFRTFLPIMLK